MSEGKRPGGLTALAVINFILGGLGVFGTLGLVAMVAVATEDLQMDDAEAVEFVAQLKGWSLIWPYIILGLVAAGLLIASGVGYLKQKRFLGRTLGNAYAVLSLISVAMWLTFLPFELGTITGLVYPLLTLALLNTTFKDDLVN